MNKRHFGGKTTGFIENIVVAETSCKCFVFSVRAIVRRLNLLQQKQPCYLFWWRKVQRRSIPRCLFLVCAKKITLKLNLSTSSNLEVSILAKTRKKKTVAITFSHQNDAYSRARTTYYWENLVRVVASSWNLKVSINVHKKYCLFCFLHRLSLETVLVFQIQWL